MIIKIQDDIKIYKIEQVNNIKLQNVKYSTIYKYTKYEAI